MRRAPFLTLVTPEGVWAYPAVTSSGVALSPAGGRAVARSLHHPSSRVSARRRAAGSFHRLRSSTHCRSPSRSSAVKSATRCAATRFASPSCPCRNRRRTPAASLDKACRSIVHLDPASTRSGEPVEAAVTDRWPRQCRVVAGAARCEWPSGFRVYPAQTEVRVAPQAGRIAGSKTFHFLAVPDSAGTFVLPEVRYPYFDATTGRFEVAKSAPQTLAVAPGAEPQARACCRALLPGRGELPPTGFGREHGMARMAGRAAAAAARSRCWPVASRTGRGRQLLTGHAPGRADLTALRSVGAGIPRTCWPAHVADADRPRRRWPGPGTAGRRCATSAVADHVKRLRDRLRAARYGPRGLGDSAELRCGDPSRCCESSVRTGEGSRSCEATACGHNAL